jgi:hypothetical protein
MCPRPFHLRNQYLITRKHLEKESLVHQRFRALRHRQKRKLRRAKKYFSRLLYTKTGLRRPVVGLFTLFKVLQFRS